MSNFQQNLEDVSMVMSRGRKVGVMHQIVEDLSLAGRFITLNGQQLVNFGSCSYLGLEHHTLLKQGAANALARYGTQFSSSRAYLSLGLYEELEASLRTMFQRPAIVTSSTSLGHIAAIPPLITPEDAIILDHQVHNSVSTAAQLLKGRGNHVELLRHSNMERLESRVVYLQERYKKVWYLADGVYSMYGDIAPYKDLISLLDKYPALHLYLDDAHGIGWTGERGSGTAIPHLRNHPQVVIIGSLNKSFAAAGGVLLLPDDSTRQLVRDCGGSLIFSGPVQPPMLGAALASAQFHQSDALPPLQAKLMRLIRLFRHTADQLGIPLQSDNLTPIQYITVGMIEHGFDCIGALRRAGFYVNIGVYPGVPRQATGIRITLHAHLTPDDITALLQEVLRLTQGEGKGAIVEEASSLTIK